MGDLPFGPNAQRRGLFRRLVYEARLLCVAFSLQNAATILPRSHPHHRLILEGLIQALNGLVAEK